MNAETSALIEELKNEKDFFQKAKLIDFLRREKQVRLHEISKATGIKPSYLSHIIRLQKLPALIVDGYYSKLIPMSHLFIIARLQDTEQMLALYEEVLTKNLSAYETEERVREYLYNIKHNGEYLPPEEKTKFLDSMKKEDVRLKIMQTKIKGKLTVEISGNLARTTEILRRLMRMLQEFSFDEKE